VHSRGLVKSSKACLHDAGLQARQPHRPALTGYLLEHRHAGACALPLIGRFRGDRTQEDLHDPETGARTKLTSLAYTIKPDPASTSGLTKIETLRHSAATAQCRTTDPCNLGMIGQIGARIPPSTILNVSAKQETARESRRSYVERNRTTPILQVFWVSAREHARGICRWHGAGLLYR